MSTDVVGLCQKEAGPLLLADPEIPDQDYQGCGSTDPDPIVSTHVVGLRQKEAGSLLLAGSYATLPRLNPGCGSTNPDPVVSTDVVGLRQKEAGPLLLAVSGDTRPRSSGVVDPRIRVP